MARPRVAPLLRFLLARPKNARGQDTTLSLVRVYFHLEALPFSASIHNISKLAIPASVSGIHHVTAYAHDPQANIDFYTGVLGLRLVKQTVLFNNPSEVFKGPTMYHFYYADGTGTPGSVITFKPHHSIQQGQVGRGQATATAFTIPEGAVDYWLDRLDSIGRATLYPVTERFGRTVIRFQDHDGQPLELITGSSDIEPWAGGPVPAEHALRGFHGVTIHPDNAQFIDLYNEPNMHEGRWGYGTVHHVAFRVDDDDQQKALRQRLRDDGRICSLRTNSRSPPTARRAS